MTDETRERTPIVPPETKHPDDRARVPLEAALGVIPGVSGLVNSSTNSYRHRRKNHEAGGKARFRSALMSIPNASMSTTRS